MQDDTRISLEKTYALLPWSNIERVKSISDDIFAFAMTLLIIEIHIPNIPGPVTDMVLLKQIALQWPEFLTYVISFFNISNYWMLHNGIFSCLEKSDKNLTRLNMLFLLTVTFLPYPTALHGEYGRHSTIALAYGLMIVINYALLFALARYALNKPELIIPDLHLPIKRLLAFRLLLPLGLAITGMFLAFFFVRLSFLFFFLVPLSNYIPSRWIMAQQEKHSTML